MRYTPLFLMVLSSTLLIIPEKSFSADRSSSEGGRHAAAVSPSLRSVGAPESTPPLTQPSPLTPHSRRQYAVAAAASMPTPRRAGASPAHTIPFSSSVLPGSIVGGVVARDHSSVEPAKKKRKLSEHLAKTLADYEAAGGETKSEKTLSAAVAGDAVQDFTQPDFIPPRSDEPKPKNRSGKGASKSKNRKGTTGGARSRTYPRLTLTEVR